MKEVKITAAELVAGHWNYLTIRMHLREHGIDPDGDLIKEYSLRDNAVIYRQPETEDDYKILGCG